METTIKKLFLFFIWFLICMFLSYYFVCFVNEFFVSSLSPIVDNELSILKSELKGSCKNLGGVIYDSRYNHLSCYYKGQFTSNLEYLKQEIFIKNLNK